MKKLFLKLIGYRSNIDSSGYRMSWGELYFQRCLDLSIGASDDKISLVIGLIFIKLYIDLPSRFKWKHEDVWESIGFSLYKDHLYLTWKNKSYFVHFPWEWTHVRHSIMNKEGEWINVTRRHMLEDPTTYDDYEGMKNKETFPFQYTLKNGTVQRLFATVNTEEREWRWKGLKFLPWPRLIRRVIDIEFSSEVGERSGSWKGGTLGCSYDLIPGESQLQCLQRMERERTFS